jgi:hypothetical protein
MNEWAKCQMGNWLNVDSRKRQRQFGGNLKATMGIWHKYRRENIEKPDTLREKLMSRAVFWHFL